MKRHLLKGLSVEDTHFSGDGGEDLEGLIDLFAGVFAGHDGADAGFALGDGGEGDACGHDSCIEEGFAEVHGSAAVSDDDGSDGGFAGRSGAAAYVEAGVGELLLEVAGVRPETLDALGFLFEDGEGGDAGGRDRWRVRGGEEEGAGAVVEVVDEVAAATDVAAKGSDGLGEGAYLHIDTGSALEVIDRATAVASENTAGMGVIDHHDGSVLVGEVAELVYRADVAVHGEDAIGDEELAAGFVLDLLE